MKLRHLEIFHAVVTCDSLSRVAEVPSISQPTVSKALRSAEMKLGFTLFQQVRGKLLLTSKAIVLFERAQSIYQDLDSLRLLADNLVCDPRAKITLGCLPSLGLSLVPGLVIDFYQQNSNLVMALTTEHTETLVKKLDLREIDSALTLQPMQQGEILTTLIAKIPLVYIDCHYRQGVVGVSQIDQQRWISPGPRPLSAATVTRRDFPTTRLNVQTYYMATGFVKRGMGCSITGIFSAQHNLVPGMIHPITPSTATNLCPLRRVDASLSPMAQKFVNFLYQCPHQQLREINLRLYPGYKKPIAPLG